MIKTIQEYKKFVFELDYLCQKNTQTPMDQVRIAFLRAELKSYEDMVAYGEPAY